MDPFGHVARSAPRMPLEWATTRLKKGASLSYAVSITLKNLPHRLVTVGFPRPPDDVLQRIVDIENTLNLVVGKL